MLRVGKMLQQAPLPLHLAESFRKKDQSVMVLLIFVVYSAGKVALG